MRLHAHKATNKSSVAHVEIRSYLRSQLRSCVLTRSPTVRQVGCSRHRAMQLASGQVAADGSGHQPHAACQHAVHWSCMRLRVDLAQTRNFGPWSPATRDRPWSHRVHQALKFFCVTPGSRPVKQECQAREPHSSSGHGASCVLIGSLRTCALGSD